MVFPSEAQHEADMRSVPRSLYGDAIIDLLEPDHPKC